MLAQTDKENSEAEQSINNKRVEKNHLISSRLFEILELVYGAIGVWDARMEILKSIGFQFSCLFHVPLNSIRRL